MLSTALKFFLGLSPGVLAVLAALGGGTATTAVVAAGFWAWNTFADNPAIIAVEQEKARAAVDRQRDADTIRIMDAANRAEEAERARIKAVTDDALNAYRQTITQMQQRLGDAQDAIDKEIEAHEKDLVAAGRACDFTDADFEWLRNKRHQSAAR